MSRPCLHVHVHVHIHVTRKQHSLKLGLNTCLENNQWQTKISITQEGYHSHVIELHDHHTSKHLVMTVFIHVIARTRALIEVSFGGWYQ